MLSIDSMRNSTNKTAGTIRFSPDVKTKLVNVARIKNQSESTVVEQALNEYFEKHGFNSRYIMGANAQCYVLFRQDGDHVTILDQQIRNGVPIESIRESYQAKYQASIELLLEKDPTR